MIASFVEAIAQNDLHTLRQIPKSDLHNHATLGGNLADIAQCAGSATVPQLTTRLRSIQDMEAWAERHYYPLLPGGLLGFEKSIAAAFVQAKHDGIHRLAMSIDVCTRWKDGGSAQKLAVTLRRLHQTFAPAVVFQPVLGLSRHMPIEQLHEWMLPHLEEGYFRALDLYGDEFAQPIRAFRPLYQLAKQHGWQLTAHVGEFGDATSIVDAVETLELDQIQHGISAATDPSVMRWLADHQLPLNITPTSNVMLSRVDDLKTHPIRMLYDQGVKVTINTDDVIVFGQGVSEEFLNLYRAGVFTAQELGEIRCNGLIEHSIASQKRSEGQTALRHSVNGSRVPDIDPANFQW